MDTEKIHITVKICIAMLTENNFPKTKLVIIYVSKLLLFFWKPHYITMIYYDYYSHKII